MSRRQVFWSFFVGIALIQAAWILATPAFGGPDEFDHAYRAEGVVRGQVAPGPEAEHGRGQLTKVRPSVVKAAQSVCEDYDYTERNNCHAVGDAGHGLVTVASGAGRYNPAYYALVGTLARPFTGVGVNYSMRIVTALMTAGLLAWAASLWTRTNRSLWPALGFLTSLTPVLLFSGSMGAPNGIECAAAVLVWVAAIRLGAVDDVRATGEKVAALVVGAIALCNTHTTGPLWLLVIVIATLSLASRQHWMSIVRTKRAQVAIALVLAGGITAVAWTVLIGTNSIAGHEQAGPPLRIDALIQNEIVWLLKSIAVFPMPNNPAPSLVYLLWLAPFLLVLAVAIRLGGRTLFAVSVVAISAVAIPTLLTVISYDAIGFAWQGRYVLPITVGLMLVPTAFADGALRLSIRWFVVLVALMSLANVVSVVHVANRVWHPDALALSAQLTGGSVLVAVLTLAGTLVMARTAVQQFRNARDVSDRTLERV